MSPPPPRGLRAAAAAARAARVAADAACYDPTVLATLHFPLYHKVRRGGRGGLLLSGRWEEGGGRGGKRLRDAFYDGN